MQEFTDETAANNDFCLTLYQELMDNFEADKEKYSVERVWNLGKEETNAFDVDGEAIPEALYDPGAPIAQTRELDGVSKMHIVCYSPDTKQTLKRLYELGKETLELGLANKCVYDVAYSAQPQRMTMQFTRKGSLLIDVTYPGSVYTVVDAAFPPRVGNFHSMLFEGGYFKYRRYLKLIIHNDGTCMRQGIMNENKWYPVTLRDLEGVPEALRSVLLAHYGGNSFFYKDLIAEDFFPPIPLGELCRWHNKKEYLESLFRLKLPKSVNRKPLVETYAACCAAPLVPKEQFGMLLNHTDGYKMDTRPTLAKRREIGRRFLSSYYRKRYGVTSVHDPLYYSIADYVSYVERLHRKVDITLGKKRLRELHLRLGADVVRREKGRRSRKLTIPNTVLKYLRLPAEYKLLDTIEKLFEEGEEQANCVGGYYQDVESGKCLIYAATINGERLTIEVLRSGETNMRIGQCYKFGNRECKVKTYQMVKQDLDAAAPMAEKEYLASLAKTKGKKKKKGSAKNAKV